MELKIISSSSKGNAYLLDNGQEALLIECGVNIKSIKQAIKFDTNRIVGALQSHFHKDHSKSCMEVMSAGINVYMSANDKKHLEINHHRAKTIEPHKQFKVGGFKIMPFDVLHDVPCLGFLINHKDTGNVIFITDTMYCAYRFKNLNNIIIEANYCPEIAKEKNKDREFLRNRVMQSHMSIDTTIEFLKANDMSKVNNVVLIHLSDTNSNEKEFKQRVEDATGKNVSIATNGKIINFGKIPF